MKSLESSEHLTRRERAMLSERKRLWIYAGISVVINLIEIDRSGVAVGTNFASLLVAISWVFATVGLQGYGVTMKVPMARILLIRSIHALALLIMSMPFVAGEWVTRIVWDIIISIKYLSFASKYEYVEEEYR